MCVFFLQKSEFFERCRSASHLSQTKGNSNDESEAMAKKFPWMAGQLRQAYSEIKHPNDVIARPRTAGAFRRCLSPDPKLQHAVEEDTGAKPKVVFNRNIPVMVSNDRRSIQVGGDINADKKSADVFKAVEFNPGMKKVTMDIQDYRSSKPGSTIHLALSYLSATTNYNPLVISEHMARSSGKREKVIKHLVKEVETRLNTQRRNREQKDERWRKQLEQIERARLDAEERENDFLLAKKQLEESRQMNAQVLTTYERQQERRRRIQLRSKVIPVADRVRVRKPTKYEAVSSK